jgi:hypothetical protein
MEEGYQSLGRNDQAEKILKELVNNFPQDDIQFEGQLRLGVLLLTQKKLGEATALSGNSKSDERIASQAQLN